MGTLRHDEFLESPFVGNVACLFRYVGTFVKFLSVWFAELSISARLVWDLGHL